MLLAGLDLAWRPESNGSAIALGVLESDRLRVTAVHSGIIGLASVLGSISAAGGLAGIAIDASLIIRNKTGQRDCERQLARAYASRHAACHPTNLSLYPDPASVTLSRALVNQGYSHLGDPAECRFQIECYPHPAMVEMFSLPERLSYKKGNVLARRLGQANLAGFLHGLADSPVLPMDVVGTGAVLDVGYIPTLKGAALKHNEDALDALVCLYICALYANDVPHRTFGNVCSGYIYVPQVYCLPG